MNPAEWKLEPGKLMNALKEVEARLNAQTETEEEMRAYVLSFSELKKSASSLYKYANDSEKRKLAHLVFLELIFKEGALASLALRVRNQMIEEMIRWYEVLRTINAILPS